MNKDILSVVYKFAVISDKVSIALTCRDMYDIHQEHMLANPHYSAALIQWLESTDFEPIDTSMLWFYDLGDLEEVAENTINYDLMAHLFERGLDPNFSQREFRTYIYEDPNIRMLKLFIKHGYIVKDPDSWLYCEMCDDHKGRMIEFIAKHCGASLRGIKTAAYAAARKNHTRSVRCLVSRRPEARLAAITGALRGGHRRLAKQLFKLRPW